MASADAAPYDGLSPDRILDALESVGIRGDGRLLALNSYENRVYQVWRDNAPPVVAKFYRPARSTLNAFESFRFAVYARFGGRAPELDRRDTLVRIGRYIARIHAVGATLR